MYDIPILLQVSQLGPQGVPLSQNLSNLALGLLLVGAKAGQLEGNNQRMWLRGGHDQGINSKCFMGEDNLLLSVSRVLYYTRECILILCMYAGTLLRLPLFYTICLPSTKPYPRTNSNTASGCVTMEGFLESLYLEMPTKGRPLPYMPAHILSLEIVGSLHHNYYNGHVQICPLYTEFSKMQNKVYILYYNTSFWYVSIVTVFLPPPPPPEST